MRYTVAVLGSILLGCSDPMDSIDLDFRAEPLEQEEVREWSVARTVSGDHRVTLRRVLQAASCQGLRAELVHTTGDLTLRVRDEAPGKGAGLLPCGYTAVLDGIPSGRYTLQVVHTTPGRRPASRVVMRQPLDIR